MNDKQHTQMVQRLAAHLENICNACAKIITTHISSIVLCGDYAYKLKRPIKLPFVDFSTLEKRHFFCLEELRINRPNAPDLYLSVQPITGTLNHPRIAAKGSCLDYAVVMRRFEDGALLSERLTKNQLNQSDIDGLATCLVAMHATATKVSASSIAQGKPTIQWLNDSLSEIAASALQKNTAEFERVKQQVLVECQHMLALDQARQANGFYRECHGDLHLANIVRLKDHVVAFDALEFETSLRQIDVISDLAFPFMDLLAQGQSHFAWRLVNRWCEQTGDYAGLAVLKFYTIYRALVRAKVAALSHEEKKFDCYWQLARGLCQQPGVWALSRSNPKIIVVCGLSGSGKSTVAQQISDKLGAIRIRADVERKRLFASIQNQPEILYNEYANTKTYARLIDLASHIHSLGMTVVVDATFLSQARIEQFTSAFSNLLKQGLQIVQCQSSSEIMRARIVLRRQAGQDPSDATPEVLDKQLSQSAKTTLRWPLPVNTIINNGSLADLELKVDQWVSKVDPND